MAKDRKNGYYWVIRSDGIKCIAEWVDYEWFFTGNEVGYPNTSIYDVLNYIWCDGIKDNKSTDKALILSGVVGTLPIGTKVKIRNSKAEFGDAAGMTMEVTNYVEWERKLKGGYELDNNQQAIFINEDFEKIVDG